ncbi:MAG: hypothetical protein HY465_00240 [Deltaproteobacteria bacterium]|nr:hypothetical protein [Deltaproteobacteria bacterium]
MKEAGLTRQERHFINLMKLMTVFFLFIAFVAALFPEWILVYVTRIGIILVGWPTRLPTFDEEVFWRVLTVSSSLTFGYVCWTTSRDVVRRLAFARVVIVAKLLSAIGFFIVFFTVERLFVYLVAAIVDAVITFVIGLAYRAVVTSRPQSFL